MNDRYTIFIKEQTGSNYAISIEKADILYGQLDKAIANKEHVNISFKDIEILITAFLNNAVGRLYEKYSTEEIEKYLNFIDMNEQFIITLKTVKDNAVAALNK